MSEPPVMGNLSDPYLSARYAAVRRRLGITSIGYNLLLIWGFWALVRTQREMLPSPDLISAAGMAIVFWGGIHLLNLPLDYWAGYALERKWQRYAGTLKDWLRQWVSTVVVMGLLQVLGTWLILLWIFGPSWGFLAALALPGAYVGLKYFQFCWIPRAVRRAGAWPKGYEGKLKAELKALGMNLPDDLYIYQSEDGSTVSGGRVGIGNASRLMISDSSLRELTPRQLALLIYREDRILGMNHESKHFFLGYGWCLVGLYAAVGSCSFEVHPAWENPLWIVAVMSSWCFLALFIFPYVSRHDFLRADRLLQKVKGVGTSELEQLLHKLQELNGTERERKGLREWIFHPLPSLQTRLENLKRKDSS